MDFNNLPTQETIDQTIKSLQDKGYNVIVTENGAEALEKIKTLIPQGASVMNGASITLETIGYTELLKSGNHNWNDLHANIVEENDPEKRKQLRKESVLSDYYLGSVHAVTQDGQMIIASNTKKSPKFR